MCGEKIGVDGRNFTCKKQPEASVALPQNPENIRSDMCIYAADVDADWGDAVPKKHRDWIQAVYDKG